MMAPNTVHAAKAITLAPFSAAALPALQALHAQQRAPCAAANLANELTDAAREHGKQAVIAWRGDYPVGCAGWVSFGIPDNGQCFAAPVVAADGVVADALIAHLVDQARRLGASELRVSEWAGEDAKGEALKRAGFTALFEWVMFTRPAVAGTPVDFATAGLKRLDFAQVDWHRFAALYNEIYRDVPNAPAVSARQLQASWPDLITAGSSMLVDAQGHYVAALELEHDGSVSLGIAESWRGRGIADLLYAQAANALAAIGIDKLKARVASTNTASMRYHTKAGFVETQPRGRVYSLNL
jgi:GNAT superfamily N-acetyltransferase